MQNETLSASEQKVFDAIVDFITDTKYPPTIRELRDLTGYNSTSTIHDKLRKLKAKGLIYFTANEKRTIRIVTPTEDVVSVVRCKNCIYANDYGTICRYGVGRQVEPEHYCSYGERKE
jgi:SOS-response transcriptional repressor LexA